MRGIVQVGFGTPEAALELAHIDEPTLDDDGVVVRVAAAGINIGAVYGVRGYPKVMRPMFRSMRAKSGVIGTDIAGTVEAVGEKVTVLEPGDEVFGSCKGAFAEYAATKPESLVPKPDNLTSEQAAAVGVSAMTALQALRTHGKLASGQHVLITGASGGVGTFAVQIAHSLGAEVTGVCSTGAIDLVRSLGADHVIDYTSEDFTQGGPEYDLILDNVGQHSFKAMRQVLRPDGLLLANGAPAPSGWFGGLGTPVKSAFASMTHKQQGRPFLSVANEHDLATLRDLTESGAVTPVIDRTYPLDEGIDAVAHVGEGHNRGTTVITM
jgi:NADPH:quinone reductase-like Zn-dependent oxidoreductase